MAWCKLEDSFRTHRKFKRLARVLGVRRAEARGLMAGLWSWCLTNAVDGNLAGIDPEEIEEGMDWEGKPGVAFDACVALDILLLETNDNGEIVIHDWMDRSGSYKRARQKAKEREERRGRKTVATVSRDRGATVATVSRDCRKAEERRGEERKGEERKKPSVALASDDGDELPPMSPECSSGDDILQVFAHYRKYHPAACKKPQTKSKEWRAIKARIGEGFSVTDLCEAIDGCHVTPHNLGDNDKNQKYLGLELIMRTSDQVTRFRENATKYGSPPPMRGAFARSAQAIMEWANDEDDQGRILEGNAKATRALPEPSH